MSDDDRSKVEALLAEAVEANRLAVDILAPPTRIHIGVLTVAANWSSTATARMTEAIRLLIPVEPTK